ncbi:hypothetical protein VNI00_011170 [Paramarasmius palmivorus]|uniref:SHSP domain-containing protein n=1 Tax=Paramarasmius palmivorus TaxID=297713 RepID=A0AAW0CD70_9AGAR
MTPTSIPPSSAAGSFTQNQTQIPLSLPDQRLVIQLARNLATRFFQQKQEAELERRKSQLRDGVSCWMPRVDVFDDPDSDSIVALFELPGVRREDAKVNVADGKLIVEGERVMRFKRSCRPSGGWVENSQNTTGNDGSTINPSPLQVPRSIAELRYGRFRREFNLPEGINPSHVHVLLENGMLHVQWPRRMPTTTRVTSPKRSLSTEESAPSRKRRKSSDGGTAV